MSLFKKIEKDLEKIEEEEEVFEDYFEKDQPSSKKWIFLALLIFLVALIPRFIFLFFITDPQNSGIGWYNDIFHHWQIAYLTKEVGLSHGFLRLWDLKGMEYFWGALHPLLLSLIFFVTRTSDIVVLRVLSSVAGAFSITILFFILRRYFNFKVALASSLLIIFSPIGIFSDASGMQEPLGICLLLLGIYFWPKKAILTGLCWGLALMVRAEYWLFTLGLVFAVLIWKEKFETKVLLFGSYFLMTGIYMKYLLNWTGNAIYPVWWNFFGNAAGKWQSTEIQLGPELVFIRYIFAVILLISLITIGILVWKRPKFYQFLLLGLGNFAFLSFFIGFTDYLKSYLPRFWVDRIFLLPYIFLAVVFSIFIFYWVPKILPFFSRKRFIWILWLILLSAITLYQAAWLPIFYYYNPDNGNKSLEEKTVLAQELKSIYKGGSILIPEGEELLTYQLVRAGFTGKNIIGQMYDPFQYKPFSDYKNPFNNWLNDRHLIIDWLKKENITILVVNGDRKRYTELVEMEKEIFERVEDVKTQQFKIYRVKNEMYGQN